MSFVRIADEITIVTMKRFFSVQSFGMVSQSVVTISFISTIFTLESFDFPMYQIHMSSQAFIRGIDLWTLFALIFFQLEMDLFFVFFQIVCGFDNCSTDITNLFVY